jgi:hypothetical protein
MAKSRQRKQGPSNERTGKADRARRPRSDQEYEEELPARLEEPEHDDELEEAVEDDDEAEEEEVEEYEEEAEEATDDDEAEEVAENGSKRRGDGLEYCLFGQPKAGGDELVLGQKRTRGQMRKWIRESFKALNGGYTDLRVGQVRSLDLNQFLGD